MLARATSTPLQRIRFGQSVPESFVFSRDGRYLYGSSYYTGRLEHLPLRGRHRRGRGGLERRDRILPAGAARRRRARRASTTPAQGFVPAIIEPRPIEGRERDHVPRRRARGRSIRSSRPGRCRRPARSTTRSWSRRRARTSRSRSVALANAYPGAAGLQELRGRRLPRQLRRSAALRELGITAAYTPSADLPADERGHVEIERTATSAGAGGSRGTARTSTTCSVRRSAAARATPPSSATTSFLIFDEPRRLELQFDLAYYDKIDTLPSARTWPRRLHRLATGGDRAALHRSCASRSAPSTTRRASRWDLVATRERRAGHDVPQLRGDARLRLRPALRATRRSGCAAPRAWRNGDRNNPFANFYFGGFGNNYVDNRSIKRYREYVRLPGLRDRRDQRRSRSRADGRIEPAAGGLRVGRHAELLPQLAAAGGVRLRPRGPIPTTVRIAASDYASVGAQVDLHFSVLHWYEMTLSVGYAVGYRGRPARGQRVDDLAQDHVAWRAHARRSSLGLAAGPRPSSRRCSARQLQAREAARSWSLAVACGIGRGRHRLRRQRPACSACTASTSSTYTRYVAPVIEELLKGLVIVALDPHASHRLPRRRGDLRLRRRRGLRDGREPRTTCSRFPMPAWARGSCAASAPRSCTAAPPRSSR